MKPAGIRIESKCPLFVCRVCRTKTGWRHQRWCELADISEPTCEDCRYRSANGVSCEHPAKRKEASHEIDPNQI